MLVYSSLVYDNTYNSELKLSPSKFILNNSHAYTSSSVKNEVSKYWKHGNPKFVPFRCGDLVLMKIQHK